MEKRSRWRRLFGFAAFRLIPLLLIVAIVVIGYQVAQGMLRRVGEQSEASSRQPQYQATATALAQASGAANPGGIVLADYQQNDLAYQFETNTPVAPEPTTAPTLPPMTPRPLPTLDSYDPGKAGQSAGGTAIPSAVPALDRHGDDLMNVLLMGNDGELSADGFLRTDTMIVVSINRTAGTVAMLSLPRDLYVYVPGWTMQRLNLAYIYGEKAGWPGGGFGLMRQTLFYNFGINIHYYAMVNLTGFKSVVDAVGGIDVAVDCAIEDLPLVDTDVPRAAYKANDAGYYVLPVGYYSMTGAEALWYARSRHSSDDFDRGRRQQQVLRAVWRKAKDTGLLNNIIPLWNQSSQIVQTNMTLEDVLGLVPMALSIDPSQVQDYRLVRTYDTTPWQPPDGSYVQIPNSDPLRQLLQNFYTPPTANQLVGEKETINVLNGTANANWDKVASNHLIESGFNALADGAADNTNYADTILIDHTGRSKGSILPQLTAALNVKPENVRVEPDPNRQYDFEVILGSNYNSCDSHSVLPVDPNPAAGG